MRKGPKEKKERSLGVQLQVKGARCQSAKCAVVRKPYRPGVHGKSRVRKGASDFGRQIKEKQKFKVAYGLNDRTLLALYTKASKVAGATGYELLSALESRLDGVVFHLGFAPSRAAARQAIVQGHVLVNGRKVRSPGFSVSVGDVVAVRPASAEKGQFRVAKESLQGFTVPSWLSLDIAKLEGKVIAKPEAGNVPFEVNLLVESFSK